MLSRRRNFAAIRLQTVFLICLIGLALVRTAGAQTAGPQHRIDTWTTEQGLPQNSVRSIVQTKDGYLWLGTFGGLVRFDGVKFTLVDVDQATGLSSNRVHALLEDRAGALWIGTEHGGLTRFANGTFKSYTAADGLPGKGTARIHEDRQGRLWLATSKGAVEFDRGRFRTYTTDDGLPSIAVNNIREDRHGTVWVATNRGIARFADDRFVPQALRNGQPGDYANDILGSRDGSLWIATVFLGLAHYQNGRVTFYTTADGLPSNEVRTLLEDRADNIWVGTGAGLAMLRAAGSADPAFVVYTTRDGLGDNSIASLYEDREGHIWVGTNTGGISRLKPRKLVSYGREDGLPGDSVVPITEDAVGNLWIGMTCGGLVRRAPDGRYTRYGPADGLGNDCVWSILAARDGTLWIGTWGGGLYKLRDGRITRLTPETSGLASGVVLALFEDRRGALWVGTSSGLNRLEHGVFTTWRTQDGLVDDDVRFITEDRSGGLWIGTVAGVSRLKDGRFTNYTSRPGGNQPRLSHGFVRAIHETADGTMWFGTYGGGLERLKDGRLTHFTVREGLYENVVSRILEDDRGNFWMTGNKGISRVARQELDELAAGTISSVTSVAYDMADGMKSSECNGGAQPAGWKARDGRLWFPTVRGVVVLDPRQIAANDVAPQVAIEDVLVNRRLEDPAREIEVPPGPGDVEIHYTALSFSAPQHVRFKYKLAGLDDHWTDAGTRRSVFYSHLPPGGYTFTVIAANSDGVWNSTGRDIRLRVVPPLYRRWEFIVAMSLSLVGFVLLISERRVRRVERAKKAQEAFSRRLIESQETERKRIAAELHDSLSQTLVVIKNRALLGLQTPADPEHMIEQVGEIVDATTHAIDEVKEIAHNLRPYLLDRLGLTNAIDAMLERVSAAHGLAITKDLDPLDGVFHQDEEINLYRIVQESVTNIVKHAGATAARVEIKRGAHDVTVTIEDNGKGFELCSTELGSTKQASTNGQHRTPGGFGLVGIAERARLLGSEPIVSSAPGAGTTIRLHFRLPHSVDSQSAGSEARP